MKVLVRIVIIAIFGEICMEIIMLRVYTSVRYLSRYKFLNNFLSACDDEFMIAIDSIHSSYDLFNISILSFIIHLFTKKKFSIIFLNKNINISISYCSLNSKIIYLKSLILILELSKMCVRPATFWIAFSKILKIDLKANFCKVHS